MRAQRLVQLLLRLQTRGGATATRLAEELEVSVRTIYRDVEALSGAGIPVYAESGPGGGIRLLDGYATRLTGLTPEEAQTLALSGVPAAAAELGLGTLLAAAELKVDAALPPELRRRAVRMRERFHLDVPGWFAREEPVPHLPTLATAVWEERRVEVRYQRRGDDDADRARVLDPLGLVLKAGTWYLVAAERGDAGSTGRGGASAGAAPVKTFRVGRVTHAEVVDEPALRPEDFDLASHWREAARSFAARRPSTSVQVRVRADRLDLLRLVVEPPWLDDVIAEAGPVDEDGWVPVAVPSETPELSPYGLLRMGGCVEVLAPPAARELHRQLVDEVASLYGGGDAGAGASSAS